MEILVYYLVGCIISFIVIGIDNYLEEDEYDKISSSLIIFSWCFILCYVIIKVFFHISILEPENFISWIVKTFKNFKK